MRIWHKKLIQVLPDKQLLGQWRELCAIASNIKNKGTPNHLLVNKVMQFPIDHLYTYASLVYDEMTERGFRPNWMSMEKHLLQGQLSYVPFPELFNTQNFEWHNQRYFYQCYFNLEEKFDCGGIKPEDWLPIYRLMH